MEEFTKEELRWIIKQAKQKQKTAVGLPLLTKVFEIERKAVKKLNIDDVSKCYTEKDIDNTYDKGFKDGNQRDLTGSLIEVL